MEKGPEPGPAVISTSAQHHLFVRLGLPDAVFHVPNGA